jgi:hypothetical protein
MRDDRHERRHLDPIRGRGSFAGIDALPRTRSLTNSDSHGSL